MHFSHFFFQDSDARSEIILAAILGGIRCEATVTAKLDHILSRSGYFGFIVLISSVATLEAFEVGHIDQGVAQ